MSGDLLVWRLLLVAAVAAILWTGAYLGRRSREPDNLPAGLLPAGRPLHERYDYACAADLDAEMRQWVALLADPRLVELAESAARIESFYVSECAR